MAFIYGIRAKDSEEYFYIGSTKHPIEHRLRQHLDQIRRGLNRNHHFVHTVNKVGESNLVIEVIEECPDDDQFVREYEVIHEFVGKGIRLTNVKLAHGDYAALRLQAERDYYDNYELTPRHVYAFLDAYENGVERTGDSLGDHLAEFIEASVKVIFEKRLDEFKAHIPEIMREHFDEQEADRQTADIYRRISEMLECNRSG